MHVTCVHCQSVNRIPDARAGEDPSCGTCGQPLLPGVPQDVGDAAFDKLITRTDVPIVVDFWAPWCGPCRMMAPQFQQAAAALKGRALFVKVNSDDNPHAALRYRVRSIPTLLLLHAGEEVDRKVGALSWQDLVRWVQARAGVPG